MALHAKEQYEENIRQRAAIIPGYDRLCGELHGNVVITLIDFADTGPGRMSKLTDKRTLQNGHHLSQWLDNGLDDISTRYVLVEDIDTDVWFTLGGIFGLEPHFFLDHMSGFRISNVDQRERAQWNTWNIALPYLSFRWYRPISRGKYSRLANSRAETANEYKLMNQERYSEKSGGVKEKVTYTVQVARVISTMRRSEWDLSASSSIAARGLLAIEERVSIYRTARNGHQYIIMLLDAVPRAETATWTQAGKAPETPFDPPSSAAIEEVNLYKGLIPRFLPHVHTASVLDEGGGYLDNLYNTHYSTLMGLEHSSDLYKRDTTPTTISCAQLPLTHLFHFVESDTMGLLHLLNNVQSDIVQSTASPDAELEDILAMRKFIATALAHLSFLDRDITSSLEKLLNLCGGNRNDPQHETVTQLKQQFKDTIEGLKEASRALTGTLQFIESHRAILEAEGITRLTELAFFFIPLSFAASLFSMQIQQLSNPVPVGHFVAFALSLSATTYALRALARSQWVHRQKQAYLSAIRRHADLLPGAPISNGAVFSWLLTSSSTNKLKRRVWLALLVCFLGPIYVVIWTRDLGHGGLGLKIALTFLFLVFAGTVFLIAPLLA
ncbi:hypothetical protein BJY04DRAFT_221492 [Aspergillus karnatakaensis]|uniref:uncharacterized protein n=1 Tax=Aspergillus karnatakaensis TaxID=1810916 RepID=UPI003CCDA07A